MFGANLEKIDWIWNQDAAEDKARDCSWGRKWSVCRLLLKIEFLFHYLKV